MSGEPNEDPWLRQNDLALLGVLSLSHFFNDFCMGVTSPMIPALEQKFHITLGAVAGIITVVNLTSNFAQPVAGAFMTRCRTPWILLVCPFLCALTFLVGYTHHPWQARMLFLVAGVANGSFHPFSFVLAQTALPRRPALSNAIFLSCGFLGVAVGGMVAGHWMQAWRFDMFHFLYLGTLVTVAPLIIHRTHLMPLAPYIRLKQAGGGSRDGARREAPSLPFALVWMLAFLMASEAAIFFFFTPKLFSVIYHSEAQGGNAIFLYGILGGITSYWYAHRADEGRPLRVAMWAQAASIVPFVLFFVVGSASARLWLIAGMGMTAGGTLPIISSLAREARGLSLGLRNTMILGGVWGVATISNYALAQLPDLGIPLIKVMSVVCIAPPLCAALLWWADRRYFSAN